MEELNREACIYSESPLSMKFSAELCNNYTFLLLLLVIFNPIIGFTYYVQGMTIIPIPDLAQVGLFNFFQVLIIHAILTIPYYYLLSCLIVWIYDKVKKKMKFENQQI
jgi:NADH:ubiquinone oxidoreductase subunit 3 (subunit A)